jgi:dTDP-4-dehydrorhamnose reductase
MRILILGGQGMLGHRLWISLQRDHDVWVTVRQSASPFPVSSVFPVERVLTDINALNDDQLIGAIVRVKPDILINCAGIIKQKESAKSNINVISVNALLPHRLSLFCQAANVRMIHMSTDCVFSGHKGCYNEDDQADAYDLYGSSKRLGEVTQMPHVITLRTSIIGQELFSQYGLLGWFLSKKDGDKILGYKNAVFSGFSTEELSRIISNYIIPNSSLSGLYHVSADSINKFELLKLLNKGFNRNIVINEDDNVCIDRRLNS